MICEPGGPCGGEPAPLRPPAPGPGLAVLSRRLGHFDDFVADLVARTERRPHGDAPVGRSWDVEGDPHAMDLVRLWAFVAEGVAAYTELTAGEAYLRTARDWLDLARLADQVGYRPAQRVAAEGWVRFDTDPTVDPVVPAGTRVQASGTPSRQPQTYEVVADTPLFADWGGLTATWVPTPAAPTGRTVRFLGDPGFRAGDQVLLIAEEAPAPSPTAWIEFLLWLYGLIIPTAAATVTPLAVVNVVGHESELGTTVVEFDRDLIDLLPDTSTTSYAAYRILDSASTARRLGSVLSIQDGSATNVPLSYGDSATGPRFAVLDRELVDLSTDRLVAVVDWNELGNRGDVVPIAHHVPVEWEVVPGTGVPASRLQFAADVGTIGALGGRRTVYVVDRRVVATNYVFPSTTPSQAPGAGLQIRVWPAPATPVPPSGKLAVETVVGGSPTWELLDVAESADQESADPGSSTPSGLVIDVVDHAPAGAVQLARASGNVVRVRHGTTVRSVLAGGDGFSPNRSLDLPASPVAAELGEGGAPVSSLVVHVDGRRWYERPTLFAAGAELAYETRLGPDGEVVLRFGDGADGAVPPSGSTNVDATYRVGGGTAGEVGTGEIDTLLGSVRGVRSVEGAGPTTGGADQPSEDLLRREAPTRARAMDRVVALVDVADVALAFPGVSHATAWLGEGPDGSCGRGPHVAVLRYGAGGVREALAAELEALSTYLDARRDLSVPMCVVSGLLVPVTLGLTVACDPQLQAAVVGAEVRAALTDPNGALAATRRALGEPIDRSDVVAVVHGVEGVVGIRSMTFATPTFDAGSSVIGRLPAERFELLALDEPAVQVVPA